LKGVFVALDFGFGAGDGAKEEVGVRHAWGISADGVYP
jgi:hypothetical protein